jgi:hypothetical protein
VTRDPAAIPHGSSTATSLASQISGATETVAGNEAVVAADGDDEGEEDEEAEVEWVRRCARWGLATAKAEMSMVVVVEDELGQWKRTEENARRSRRGKAGLCGRSGEDGRTLPPRARKGGGGGIGVHSAWRVRLWLRGWE